MSYSFPRWTRRLVVAAGVAAAPALASAADEPSVRPEHAALFKKLDADGDGQITKEEVPEEQRRLLERLIDNHDKNKNGKLSAEELSAGLSEERPKGEVGPPSGSGGPGRPGGGQFNPEEMFKRMDRNGDGKVTPDEAPEERREMFRQLLSRVDDDKDGAATLDEFKQGFGGGRPGQPSQPGQPARPSEPGRPGMPQPGGDGLVRAIDADKNGEISADEIAGAADALKKLDRNGDGKITREEIGPPPQPAGRPGMPPEGFRPDPERFLGYMKQQDKDGDGKLSKDEVGERMRENFANLDKNGDGKLDDVELRQMAMGMAGMQRPGGPEGRRPEGDRKSEGDRKPGEARRPEGGPGPERRPDVLADAEARFKQADKDGDGKLSKDELPERMRERLDKIDTDGDGKASPEEMREAFRRMMENRGERRPDGEGRRSESDRPKADDAAPKKE